MLEQGDSTVTAMTVLEPVVSDLISKLVMTLKIEESKESVTPTYEQIPISTSNKWLKAMGEGQMKLNTLLQDLFGLSASVFINFFETVNNLQSQLKMNQDFDMKSNLTELKAEDSVLSQSILIKN